jgi:signal recognition particle subunit SRP54
MDDVRGQDVLKSVNPGQQFIKIVHDKMVALLGSSRQELELKGKDTTSVILFLGLQGAGKTTAAAKLANLLKTKESRRVLLVACDLVRPAAVEQLSVLGKQIDVDVFREETKDAVKVAKNALKYAKKNLFDTVIIDTAGRLQIDEAMMGEIVQVRDAVKPDETILVADAMTGQTAVDIAKSFDEQMGLTGVILTKFDSDTRGGAAISLRSVTGKPIKFIGVGEKIEDLEPFYPERIAGRILGMGDVVSLVEKAQEHADEEEALRLQKKMAGGTFTLEDYLAQFQQVKKMGSMDALVKMLPGAANLPENAVDEKKMKKEEAIILSMTTYERQNYRIIGPPRRKRIAKGSGTSVAEVNRLLKTFEKTRNMMKKLTKNKGMQAQLMKQLGGM